MTYRTNTNYGTWYNHRGDNLTVHDSVATALGDYGNDYDIDALTAAYRTAVNDALPPSVTLAGEEFYGPYQPDDGEWDDYPVQDADLAEATGNRPALDIGAIIESVDFWALAEQHELWDIDRCAELLGYSGPSARGTARKTLSRLGVKAAEQRQIDGGRIQAFYRAADVRAAHANRPGRGKRTDLAD